ncbi:MAG TPA: Tex family protein [Bryobacteraceae bacterium]|nr:Tex family protein [Bryobacteraceae bacterium]
MPEHQSLSPDLLIHVGRTLQVPMQGLLATVELLDEGSTVPFIARYRKESTGNLDEVQIRSIEEKLLYFRELISRKETILASIQEQGKLTGELKARIDQTLDKSELEDLYLPYKPKRRTKAIIAREKGLEPLADYLWNQEPSNTPLKTFAASFVSAEKGVASVEDALEGARHILAEAISDHADIRKLLRRAMFEEGVIVGKKAADAVDEQEKFAMYYDYREPVKQIPSHRMLAIRRGEAENVLYFQIELDPLRPLDLIRSKIHKQPGDWTAQLNIAAEDAWKRLLSSSITGEVRLELKQRADSDAIQVFRENLQNVLLAPPAGQLAVLGLDPGIRTGCKIAVVNDTGKFLGHDVIYPFQPKNDVAGAERTLKSLIEKFSVRAIAIGNGTASRETEALVRAFLKKEGFSSIFCVMVNESGASIYSASEIARQEFPDLDLTVRGAISIARRLQDPLAELVKLDPKSIGVGQYQHDVDQKHLHRSLETVIESCVNRVGVDLNTASWTLLRYVAGINERTAQKIVEFRNEHGRFRSRVQLTAVPGIGPKTFEQAAGFLRIRHGDYPLDVTAVHPESYPVVEQIAKVLDVSIEQLIAKPALLEKVDKGRLTAGVYTLNDILDELRKPGRDPRDTFAAPDFNDNVKEIGDLQAGMTLEGIATNVTKFGVFVDIGVHQDGLVHISELADRYIKEPGDVVKTGQIVKVHVLSADPKTRRISLSMKTPGAKTAQGAPDRPKKPAAPPKPQATMDDKLAALADRWKRR